MSVMHGRKCDGISQCSYLLFEVNELNFIFFQDFTYKFSKCKDVFMYSMPKLTTCFIELPKHASPLPTIEREVKKV